QAQTDDTHLFAVHSSFPTARPSGSNPWFRAANSAGVNDWGPSESAFSGQGCTSIISPSAPAANAAQARGKTRSLRPAAWLGSTITGRWLKPLTRGTALISSIFRVAVSK